jgi:hypothetical protein
MLVECIPRNVPIILRRFSAAVEDIGADYPRFYEGNHGTNVTSLLTEGALTRAVALLQAKAKSYLSMSYFCESLVKCAVF